MFRRSISLLMKKHTENWKPTVGPSTFPVVKNARQVLIQLYRKTLEDIKEVPITSAYRQNIESICKYRLSVCEFTHSHKEIELAIESGHVEELIEQAKGELELIPFMLKYKPWEVPLDWQPPKLIVDGFEFDWKQLRQDRVEESFTLRSQLSENERKNLLTQWCRDSNPDNEIYSKEMAAYKRNGCFIDMKSFKGVRFGA